jgi:LysR family glycine cleavage system transcriptional activator
MTLPPLQALICFEAVARHRSMKEAAQELHITASAVSQQIAKLEAWVNVRLFMRGPRFLTLTTEGQIYLREIQPVFNQLSRATQRLMDSGWQTTVTVSCTAEIASQWLLPRLRGFEYYHPGVEVIINTTHRTVDLRSEGIDFAVCHEAHAAAEWVSHRLLHAPRLPGGNMALIYDKAAILQPVCYDFRDWLLEKTAADNV